MSRMLSYATIVAVLVHTISTSQLVVAQNNSRGTQTQRRKRPQPKPLRVQKVSPRLQQFLEEWHNATKKVKTIEGITHKFIYDSVFAVEKRGKGTLYYEAPDKGRLDIDPVKIKEGEKSLRKSESGASYSLMGADAEKWLCTGQNILQVDVAKKKGSRYKIPPENRGANIMHGPLPFLLGMPPNVIKRRYQLSVESETATHLRLKAIPNWRHDRANYKMARIILDKKTFMPSAVQMFDPTGNLETVYTFSQIRVNKKKYFWQKHPIAGFPLKGIEITEMMPNSGSQNKSTSKGNSNAGRVLVTEKGLTPAKKINYKRNPKLKPVDRSIKLTVPNVIGLNHADAKTRLRAAGFDVIFKRGSVARTKNLEWRVENQNPNPRTVSHQGYKIELVLYIKQSDLKQPTRTANERGK